MNPTQRFFSKVVVIDCGCWIWIGTQVFSVGGKRPYPQFFVEGKRVKAYRWIYERTRGPIPPELEICHRCPCCGNEMTLCVNPEHVTPDTRTANQRDAVLAGAHRNPSMLGETNPAHKLRENDVRDILHRLNEPLMVLAREFNVSESLVSMIRKRKRWSHIVV